MELNHARFNLFDHRLFMIRNLIVYKQITNISYIFNIIIGEIVFCLHRSRLFFKSFNIYFYIYCIKTVCNCSSLNFSTTAGRTAPHPLKQRLINCEL